MAKAKILVVDDQPLIRTMLADLLTDAGYEVAAAADGEEGLALLKREAPALVILDKVMPRMGGTRFILESRGAGLSRAPALILYSAAFTGPPREYADETFRVRLHVSKTIKGDVLLELVADVLGRASA
ncbi:MAG: response regulator [candidate division NC10 bacterium]|nr:response regulator [candidate division NC10 bacterium]